MDAVTLVALLTPSSLNAAAGELLFDSVSDAIPKLSASAAPVKEIRPMLDILVPAAFAWECGAFARARCEGLAAEASVVPRGPMIAIQVLQSGGPPERTAPRRPALGRLRTDRTTPQRWFSAGGPDEFRRPNGGSSEA